MKIEDSSLPTETNLDVKKAHKLGAINISAIFCRYSAQMKRAYRHTEASLMQPIDASPVFSVAVMMDTICRKVTPTARY
ncbi:hypothetical protein PsorP6_015558 [Peronosclerospora sorghi]|uniref:Uncharacterized protein n=1 Tax=Peronosclerospora sorghi TaxID=230839 RepID=A0ACC0WPE3_9STRA|nr:hypothetical protein PsorP6_015558 [Peronosclerospora sorghi]